MRGVGRSHLRLQRGTSHGLSRLRLPDREGFEMQLEEVARTALPCESVSQGRQLLLQRLSRQRSQIDGWMNSRYVNVLCIQCSLRLLCFHYWKFLLLRYEYGLLFVVGISVASVWEFLYRVLPNCNLECKVEVT